MLPVVRLVLIQVKITLRQRIKKAMDWSIGEETMLIEYYSGLPDVNIIANLRKSLIINLQSYDRIFKSI